MSASRILQSAAMVAAAILLWHFSDFVTDDALISLRYAKHLAAGHGLTWNIGEDPVEGYSNFLHVLIGGAAIVAGLSPLAVLRAINVGAALALPLLAFVLARRIGANRGAPLAAVLVGIHVPIAYWAMSGLETALYSALGTCSIVVATTPGRWRAALAFGLAGLACLTRPEGPIFVVAVILAMCTTTLAGVPRSERWRRGKAWLRADGPWGAVFGLCFGAYVAWRWWYFGYLLPNPVYVKASASNPWELIAEFVTQCPLLVALAVASVRVRPRMGNVALWYVVLIYVLMLYNVKASVADLHRFFLPIVPTCAALAAVVFDRCLATQSGWRFLPMGSVVLSIVVELLHPKSGFFEARRRVDALMGRVDARVRLATWINREVPLSQRVAIGDVGVVGYGIEHPIDDLFALNSEAAAHEFSGRKAYVRSIVEKQSGVIVLVSKERDSFVPKYKTDGWVRKSKAFSAYDHVGTISASPGRYHYWLYVANGVDVSPPRDEGPTDSRGVVARIEALR